MRRRRLLRARARRDARRPTHYVHHMYRTMRVSIVFVFAICVCHCRVALYLLVRVLFTPNNG